VSGYQTFNGVTVDGYIMLADIFVDENNNFIRDSGENNTTSDSEGKFTSLKYTSGNLTSIGGTDVDSGNLLDQLLLVSKLSEHNDLLVITPVTSVAALMVTPDNIKAALGIDNSIDIATTDPIATMADGDKYEYLYEKGSQITALVFSMQSALNEINALQETSETYFLELAKTLEAQYAETSEVVDIETEVFIDAYVDAVLVTKETAIQDDRKTDIKNALHSLVPAISVRNKAAITTALSNFTTGQFITDFKAMAQGTASSSLAASYATDINTLIAADQNIELSDLVINIRLVDDSAKVDEDSSVVIAVLSNDTYTAPAFGFSITTSAPSNGQVLLNTDNTLSYLPNANFNGTDTFTYTVTVDDRSDTANVSVVVNPINDVPVITSSSTFSAAENQTAVGTATATDGDGDTLTYTLTGTDAASLSINGSSGVITFNSAPDYETKATYSVTVNVSDGTNTTSQALSINVTDVNETSPVITSSSTSVSVSVIADSVSTNEDNAVTLNPLANDTIVTAGSPVSVSAGSPGNGSVVVNSGNTLTYTPSLNFFGTDSFTYTVTVELVSSSAQVTITVNGVNDLPIINSLSTTLTPDENQTGVVTVNAADVETSSLSYSISGTDSSLFSISNSGALTFDSAPDYESPGDADADNSYAITIAVGDGTDTTSQAVTVDVQNVADQVSGVAVDGYVAGATVFQDLDNDGVLDSGEPNTSTNALGSFSLTLSSVNKSAPVRIINGYDLATNEIHPSVMDISVTETGSYIITPISTLVGRLKIEDTTLSGTVPQSMISAALGITLTDSPNDSILGFDPIAYFNGSDSTLAAEARPVFAASQLLMAQGGGNYAVNKYITDQVLAALSTTLTNASGTSVSMSSAADIIAIKQDAYDAIFNGIVDTTLVDNPPINNVQFKNNKAVMTDYLNGSSSSQVQHSLYGVHDGTTTLVADLVGAKLDYENLKQIIDNDGTGTPLDLSFELSSLPVGSGSTSVILRLFYGSDVVQDSNEDYLQVALTANWESDGTTFQLMLPANSNLVATFFDRDGSTLSRTVTNLSERLITGSMDGPNRPQSLAIRLSTLFNTFPTEVSGLSSFLDGAATFTYQVEFGSFTIYDHLENPFTKIQGTFAVNSTPDIAVFADDIYVHENATTKDITFRLSQASSSDVTVDYAIAAASTASSSDYTLSAGTVTIPAGSTSTTLAVAVINDTAFESQEEIRLNLSHAQNAVLGRTTVSAYITDGEKILGNSTQKAILVDNIFKDSKASISSYLKNELDSSSVTISGTSYTYSQVLINNSITADVYAYVDSIADDYEVMAEAIISAIMTKSNAYVDSQLSGFSTYSGFAQALTQLNSGLKGLEVSQIVGTNINKNGSYPTGQSISTLQTAVAGKVDTLVTLAADTVADILGTDTNANFPNANVIIGTDGDDTITGTSGSDLIATFNGTDTVNALAGNDKILGGSGVDTINGGDNDDHIYGYAGNDVLAGDADADKILGGLDNDTIRGGAGNDDLRGEAGNDTIYTGTGSDTVTGGLGDDTIVIDGL
jgi:Ca2+-binding RTX toxin-like protein